MYMKHITNKMLGWTTLVIITILFVSGFVEGLMGTIQLGETLTNLIGIVFCITATWGSIRLVKS